MGTERKPWKISPGDPSRPGVTGKGNRYNFAVDTGSGEPLELLFYKNGSEEQRILLDETYRPGSRYAVLSLPCGGTAPDAMLCKELRALYKVMVPEPYCRELAALYAEMNALQTGEARLYKSLDKLEAVIQHNEADISTWEPHEYDLNLTYADDIVAFSPYLRSLREAIRDDTKQKIADAQKTE